MSQDTRPIETAPEPADPPQPDPPSDAVIEPAPGPAKRPQGRIVSVVLGVAVATLLASGGLLVWHAESKVNKVALTAAPKPVSMVKAKATPFQPSRSYVGTLEPWLTASVGPQLISAYIDTVLVRPGAVVQRGEVLATLDCRDANAESQAVASAARAIDARGKALASESARIQNLLAQKFVSENEAEEKAAQSASKAAELDSMRAKLAHSTLEVNDCVLRAAFDGEVAMRTMDPGGFVHPGNSILTVVDRTTVRLTVDVPEIDFDMVPPGTAVRISVPSTKQELVGVISRRAPAADPSTRTVHFEVDLVDPDRRIPVGTTGELSIDVGKPEPATEIPIYAASVRGPKATVFVIEGDVAHLRTVKVKGEIGGSLFVEDTIPAGALIVTEGRALLADNDRVSAKLEQEPPSAPAPARASAGAGAPAVIPVKTTAKEHHQ